MVQELDNALKELEQGLQRGREGEEGEGRKPKRQVRKGSKP